MSTSKLVQPVASLGAVEVPRTRVLSYVEKANPRALLINGPSGYGKSVLAGQIARLPQYGASIWIECGGHLYPGSVLLDKVADAVASQSGNLAHLTEHHVPESADSLVAVRQMLEAHPHAACIVVDDVMLDGISAEIAALFQVFAATQREHTLILTTRAVPACDVGQFSAFTSIDVGELRLCAHEAGALMSGVEGPVDLESAGSDILDLTGGQAALISVIARHMAMRGGDVHDVSGSLDLTALLVLLAESQLEPVEAEALYAISLLGHATRHDLALLSRGYDALDIERLSRCIPLLRLSADASAASGSVRMHMLAQEVYTSQGYVERHVGESAQGIRNACMRVLEGRGEYARLIPLLVSSLSSDELSKWLLAHGDAAVSSGHGAVVGIAADSLSPAVVLSYPRLLLMSTEHGAVSSDTVERLARVCVAIDLATCAGDTATVADGLIAKAAALKDLGRLQDAAESFAQLAALPECAVTRDRALINVSYLLALSSALLDWEGVARHRSTVVHALEREHLPDPVKAILLKQSAISHFALGDISRAVNVYAQAAEIQQMPTTLRAAICGNLAFALLETGRVGRAAEVAEEHVRTFTGPVLRSYRASGESVRSFIEFLFGSEKAALQLFGEQVAIFAAAKEWMTEAHALLSRAALLRAVGDIDGAMSDIESVIGHPSTQRVAYYQKLAEVELAANFLALGDLEAAFRQASRVREFCDSRQALSHVARADLILAEVERRRGCLPDAVSRLAKHQAYILGDNANFTIAIYVRAFPAMLGMLAAAIGANNLPAHLLRMFKPEQAEAILAVSRQMLTDDEWRTFASRLLGAEDREKIDLLSAGPSCRVRLFGGLEVTVGERRIAPSAWKKRKGRLLFAMLVLQQGRHISRESIYGHLWPEMDEERARNNLYVIWSSMKSALTPGSARAESCPYIVHKGGACRISTDLVRSDVAEFDETVSRARSCEAAGDATEALRAYESLVDLYRGEFLPEEIYDDWFSSARNQYRHDFCAAMLRAHHLYTEKGEHASALRVVRRAISEDSWREDLCQAALKSQIALGQRGSAVETYLSCRSRLAEDLGLDPSRETVRLYEQILAMEDGPDVTGGE